LHYGNRHDRTSEPRFLRKDAGAAYLHRWDRRRPHFATSLVRSAFGHNIHTATRGVPGALLAGGQMGEAVTDNSHHHARVGPGSRRRQRISRGHRGGRTYPVFRRRPRANGNKSWILHLLLTQLTYKRGLPNGNWKREAELTIVLPALSHPLENCLNVPF
jgi:hypothetical protein